MEPRLIGLVLVWGACLVLAPLLIFRLKKGAWEPEAFDQAPPVSGHSKRLALLAAVMALLGVICLVWSVL